MAFSAVCWLVCMYVCSLFKTKRLKIFLPNLVNSCYLATATFSFSLKVIKIRYVDLYSALDDKYLVLKALRHGSHSLTCKQHHACL